MVYIVLRCGFKKEKTQPKPAYVLEHSSQHLWFSFVFCFFLAYFRNAGNPHLGVFEETVLALQSDQNQDLTFFAALEPKRGNVTDPWHAARTELTHLWSLKLVTLSLARAAYRNLKGSWRCHNCLGRKSFWDFDIVSSRDPFPICGHRDCSWDRHWQALSCFCAPTCQIRKSVQRL